MRYPLLSLVCILGFWAAPMRAQTPPDMGGQVIATLAGEPYALPLLNSDIDVRIEGDMATVEITQSFANEAHLPLQAQYLFPLNQNAAIYGMDMTIGDEVVTAVIQEKKVAQQTFDTAASEGKAAALLTQHRPNMFTQDIANLMPGLPVQVTLRYVQMIPKIDGAHELVIPLVVGPRYTSPEDARPDPLSDVTTVAATDDETPLDTVPPPTANSWNIAPVPAHPPTMGLDLPADVASDRVSLSVQMVSGLPVTGFDSATHPLEVTATDTGLTAHFAQGRALDNKDLVIRYTLGGKNTEAASLSHVDARGGFVSVMIEPPALPDPSLITPRELVFVLDTSGSMHGQPMAASKLFMDTALRQMRAGDYFRIIPFSNRTHSFSGRSQPATAANIRAARAYVYALSAGGGTEIDHAIRTAFATQQPKDVMRIVVFLSDGYIGGEARVLKTLNEQIGAARVYAFGVGTSVNRYLLDAMAEEGRGYARYVPVGEDAGDVAQTLAADLKTPVLTDISVDWGMLEVTDVTPRRIPDLFAGQGLRIYARHTGHEDAAQITINGLVQGRAAQMPVDVTLSDQGGTAALPLIWARERIKTLGREVAIGHDPEAADAEITRLGLTFSLQTKNTSFVAVSQAKVNDSAKAAQKASVPLPLPVGMSAEGLTGGGFSGSSTPEPQALLGLMIFAVVGLLGLRRRQRRA